MIAKLYRQLRWFIQYYKKEYIISFIFVVISYVLVLVPPWMVGFIADGISYKTLDHARFWQWIIFLLLVIGLLYGVNYVWSYYIYKASDAISRVSREHLMRKFLRQTPVFFGKHSTGSLMGKATNDVGSLDELAGYGSMAMLDATLAPFTLILIMAIQVSVPLTLLAVLPLPFLVAVSTYIGKKVYPLYDRAQEAFDLMNEKVLDNVAGVRVVRAYAIEARQKADFAAAAEKLYTERMALVRVNQFFPLVGKVLPALCYVIALGCGAWFISRGRISMGQLVSFIFYLDMLVWPMFALGDFINVAQQGLASMERINELYNYQEEVVDDPNSPLAEAGCQITFDHFNFYYPGAMKPQLEDISFSILPGQTIGVVGRVGSGKTTLLRQLLRFYPLTAQDGFYWGDRPINDYRVSSIRNLIGYAPQQLFLFSRSIRENILLGSRMENEDEAERLLQAVIDVADFRKDLEQLPQGLDTPAGEKGIALSGGQKQRICIARALLKNPEILILDDSLSAVDARTEETILAGLKRSRKGKTTLISAHRLSCVKEADLILVLDNGRIIEQGSHEALIAKGGWYAEQFARQQLEQSLGMEVIDA